MVFNTQVSFVNTFQVSMKEASLPATIKGTFPFGGTLNPISLAFDNIGLTFDVCI